MKTTHCLLMAALSVSGAGVLSGTLELAGFGGARYAVQVTSLQEAKFKATTRQQYDFSCGSAAVATLLTHHYGYPVTEQSVFDEMFALGDQPKIRRDGFSLLDMKKYMNAHGFEVDGFTLPLNKLPESGLPAIVLIVDKGYHHFVVIKGMREGRVLIGDPSNGTRALPVADFEAMWTNKLLFVVHSHQAQARFNRESDWQVAPQAPLAIGGTHDGLGQLTLGKYGPGDF